MKKEKKKKETQRSQDKKKIPFRAIGSGEAPRWRPDFEQRSRRQTKNCHP